jgi:hypothetical protein
MQALSIDALVNAAQELDVGDRIIAKWRHQPGHSPQRWDGRVIAINEHNASIRWDKGPSKRADQQGIFPREDIEYIKVGLERNGVLLIWEGDEVNPYRHTPNVPLSHTATPVDTGDDENDDPADYGEAHNPIQLNNDLDQLVANHTALNTEFIALNKLHLRTLERLATAEKNLADVGRLDALEEASATVTPAFAGVRIRDPPQALVDRARSTLATRIQQAAVFSPDRGRSVDKFDPSTWPTHYGPDLKFVVDELKSFLEGLPKEKRSGADRDFKALLAILEERNQMAAVAPDAFLGAKDFYKARLEKGIFNLRAEVQGHLAGADVPFLSSPPRRRPRRPLHRARQKTGLEPNCDSPWRLSNRATLPHASSGPSRSVSPSLSQKLDSQTSDGSQQSVNIDPTARYYFPLPTLRRPPPQWHVERNVASTVSNSTLVSVAPQCLGPPNRGPRTLSVEPCQSGAAQHYHKRHIASQVGSSPFFPVTLHPTDHRSLGRRGQRGAHAGDRRPDYQSSPDLSSGDAASSSLPPHALGVPRIAGVSQRQPCGRLSPTSTQKHKTPRSVDGLGGLRDYQGQPVRRGPPGSQDHHTQCGSSGDLLHSVPQDPRLIPDLDASRFRSPGPSTSHLSPGPSGSQALVQGHAYTLRPHYTFHSFKRGAAALLWVKLAEG